MGTVNRKYIRFWLWIGILPRNRKMGLFSIINRTLRRRSGDLIANIASNNTLMRSLLSVIPE